MSDGLRDQFGERLGEVARSWRGCMNRRLQPYGLSVPQWLALRALAREGSGIVQRDLALAIGVEGSTLVGLLDRLAKAGLIVRRESPTDRRYKSVHLSEAAVQLIPELEEIHRELRYQLHRDISSDDLAACLKVFDQVLARARSLDDAGAEPESLAASGR